MTFLSEVDPKLLYPDSDGKPMSDNTEQFRWIVAIKENLEILFAAIENVFVAGDLLWYPVQSTLVSPTAPDVMVVFGRPKGKRGSYQQWKEDEIAPQVAFEILSPSNTSAEMERKREFYEAYGVEEYYLYDPDRLRLAGWLRQEEQLVAIESMEGWVSPRLGIRFSQVQGELEIYRPDGRKFLSSVELDRLAEQERQRAELERQRAEQEQQRADREQQRADREQQRADQEQQRAEQAEAQLQQVVQYLLRSGMALEQIAAATGVEIDRVQNIVAEGDRNL
jgi:Uma2 family endonuclease